MSFLADRYHQIQEFEQVNDEKITISDYYITKSKIFASINLKRDEVELFNALYDIMFQKVLRPRLVVFLYRPVKELFSNVMSRGREYEMKIDSDYLNTLQNRYLDFFESSKTELSVLILNLGNRDFVRDKQCYHQILKSIGKQRLKGVYQETI
jgi:deoxyadenosine/deoxycytidine kinase